MNLSIPTVIYNKLLTYPPYQLFTATNAPLAVPAIPIDVTAKDWACAKPKQANQGTNSRLKQSQVCLRGDSLSPGNFRWKKIAQIV